MPVNPSHWKLLFHYQFLFYSLIIAQNPLAHNLNNELIWCIL